MANFVVTTTDDTVADDGEISLREALELANAAADADTITFDASLSGQTITLGGTALNLLSDVSIDGDINGDGVSDITISGGRESRVFLINDGTSILNALTITDGRGSLGGALFIKEDAIVNLSNCTLSGNKGNTGGAINNHGTATLTNTTLSGNYGSFGGGMQNRGTVTLINSTISGNEARWPGGGVDNLGSATLINSTVSGNQAFWGGGINNQGTANLTNVTITGNEAFTGGGVYNHGSATLTNSTISGNNATGSGGGIDNQSDSSVTLSNSIVLGNRATTDAEVSGLVTVTNSLIGADGETAADVFAQLNSSGGGLLADNGGSVQTIALKADPLNPALDAGDDTEAPMTDSRGSTRVDAPTVANNGTNISDLGAYELQLSNNPGGNGPDVIFGTNRVDNLIGNGGNDIIYGFANADIITGNLGNDHLFGGDGRDVILGGAGADTINGGAHSDELRGEAGNDVLIGGGGRDLLIGGVQNDRLFGDADNDRLRGGEGDDFIVGGLGSDSLYGGEGGDKFIYLSSDESLNGTGADRIFDFVQGEDVIDFRAISPVEFDFVGTSLFSGDGPEIRIVETPNGNTSVFADVDGDALVDMRVVVLGTTGLTEADFLL